MAVEGASRKMLSWLGVPRHASVALEEAVEKRSNRGKATTAYDYTSICGRYEVLARFFAACAPPPPLPPVQAASALPTHSGTVARAERADEAKGERAYEWESVGEVHMIRGGQSLWWLARVLAKVVGWCKRGCVGTSKWYAYT